MAPLFTEFQKRKWRFSNHPCVNASFPPQARSAQESGFSLLELMIAMAICTVALGAAAQMIVTYYAAMASQSERMAAIHNCKSVVEAMRAHRDEASGEFPDIITTRWPDSGVVEDFATLRGETITVTYTDPNASSLEVQITSQWLDLRGRPFRVTLSSVISNE